MVRARIDFPSLVALVVRGFSAADEGYVPPCLLTMVVVVVILDLVGPGDALNVP